MDKEKALKALLSEGYSASIENSILMVAVPKDYTEKDITALQKELREKLDKMGYSASWGISYQNGTASNTAAMNSPEDIAGTENMEEEPKEAENTTEDTTEAEYEEFGTLGEFKL